MNVLIETSVFSLAFRRRESAVYAPRESDVAFQTKRLVLMRRAFLIGAIRQEALTGVRSDQQFEKIRTVLDSFGYFSTDNTDHDSAARCFKLCRAKGIAAGDIDMLICATAIRYNAKIMTVDNDFVHYARCLPIQLFDAGRP